MTLHLKFVNMKRSMGILLELEPPLLSHLKSFIANPHVRTEAFKSSTTPLLPATVVILPTSYAVN